MQIATRLPVPSSLDAGADYYHWFFSVGLIFAIIASVALHHLIERPSLRLNALAKESSVFRSATLVFVIWVMVSFLVALAAS